MSSFAIPHLEKDFKRRSAQAGTYSLISQASMVAIQTSTMLILVRLLNASDFGLFAMVTSVVGGILLLKDMGLSTATVQKTEITEVEINFLFWTNVCLSSCISLVMICTAAFYHHLLPASPLPSILAVLSLGIFVSGFGVQHQAILARLMRFRSIAISDILSILTSSLLGVFLAWRGCGYWALVFMQVGYYLINTLFLSILSGWRPGRPAWSSNAGELLAFGGHLTGANIMVYITRNLDNVLIGLFWGPVQVGYYSRAYQLLLQPTLQIAALLKSVLVPTLSRLNNRPEQFREMCVTVLGHMARISLPAVTYMLLTSDWIIKVVLGDKWQPSTAIFSCLGVAALLQPFTAAASVMLISQGRTRELFHVLIMTSLAMGIFICLGLPWGATGVAMAISICELVVRLPSLFYVIGRGGALSTSDLYRSFLPGLLPSLAVLAVTEIVRHSLVSFSAFESLLISGVASLLVAFVIVLLVPGGRAALLQIQYTLFSILPARTRV